MTRNDHFGSPIKASKRSGFGLSSSAEKKQGAPGNRDARGLTAKYALGRPLTPELQQQILLLTKQAVEAVCTNPSIIVELIHDCDCSWLSFMKACPHSHFNLL